MSTPREAKRPKRFRPLKVFATKSSGAWTENQLWLATPENAKLIEGQIASGFTPNSAYDLANFGGKTVANLTVQAIYVASNDNNWDASDSNSIDEALAKVFTDWRLTTVVSQYFTQPITTKFLPSTSLTNNLDTYQQTDVENLVTTLHQNGGIAGDFPNTVFCFLLAPGIRLYDSSGDDSYSGLGGYHGSVDVTGTTGTGTDRVYYAVGVYSQQISSTTTNGIVVFNQSWKNVVATFYHEINEMRTDADVELATSTTANVLGWYSSAYGEIGDIPIEEAGSDLAEVILDVNLADGSGTAPVQLLYSNMDQGPSLGLDNGALLREADGAIWVVFGGGRFAVPDMPTLDRLYGGKPIIGVATGGVNGIPTIPVDGTLLGEENGAIWVIFGGARFPVPDPATLARLYGGKPISQLWNGGPETLPAIPVDGTYLREESGIQVYVIQQGHKVPAQPPYLGPVDILWDGALAQIPS